MPSAVAAGACGAAGRATTPLAGAGAAAMYDPPAPVLGWTRGGLVVPDVVLVGATAGAVVLVGLGFDGTVVSVGAGGVLVGGTDVAVAGITVFVTVLATVGGGGGGD